MSGACCEGLEERADHLDGEAVPEVREPAPLVVQEGARVRPRGPCRVAEGSLNFIGEQRAEARAEALDVDGLSHGSSEAHGLGVPDPKAFPEFEREPHARVDELTDDSELLGAG